MVAVARRHLPSDRLVRTPRGLGGSSYIDSVILRDRDPTGWTISTADEPSERRYYCQNWRADVSVILPSTGCDGGSGPGILEWIKYSAYGVPQAFSMADYNRDGAANSSDFSGTTGDFDIDFGNGDPRADVNFDGAVTLDDLLLIANAASEAAGRGTQSCASTANRIGYAGYVWDPAVSVNHVRHRVYVPELGRWTRRDPLGYVDGMNLFSFNRLSPIMHRDSDGLRGKDIDVGYTLTPAEKEYCLFHPYNCGYIDEQQDKLIKKLRQRWPWRWWDELVDENGRRLASGNDSVNNAVVHCALACILRNGSDGNTAYLDWLYLHETSQPDFPNCGNYMDLDNDDIGWDQKVVCPPYSSCSDVRAEDLLRDICINRCESLARSNRLTWISPTPPLPPNTPNGNLPNTPGNCPPGSRSRVMGCCSAWV